MIDLCSATSIESSRRDVLIYMGEHRPTLHITKIPNTHDLHTQIRCLSFYLCAWIWVVSFQSSVLSWGWWWNWFKNISDMQSYLDSRVNPAGWNLLQYFAKCGNTSLHVTRRIFSRKAPVLRRCGGPEDKQWRQLRLVCLPLRDGQGGGGGTANRARREQNKIIRSPLFLF